MNSEIVGIRGAMSEIDDLLVNQFRKLPPKPADDAKQTDKKRYSEQMSAAAAIALAEALRRKGLKDTYPLMPPETDLSVAVEVMGEKNGDGEEESGE